MKTVGIIPARYASTRFPGKPLVDIKGKSMIRRVYEQCEKSVSLNEVIVATDDPQIYKHVESWKGNVIMTSADHPSGTDRCKEAMLKAAPDTDYVINIQGDEPFINPKQIDSLAALLEGKTEIATLIKKITEESDLFNPNIVKVVKGGNKGLYFSRSVIPHLRNIAHNEWLDNHLFFRHIGIYAYREDILQSITSLEPGKLEQAESLEQLRWLENGYEIRVAETEFESIGIDTPEDLEKVFKDLK